MDEGFWQREFDGQAPLRHLFERSADAMLLLDAATRQFVKYNPAALELLCCTPEEVRSAHPALLSPPRQPDGRDSFEKADELIAEALRAGSHRFEWVHRSPHREDFLVEVLLTALQPSGGPWMLAVWRDITERTRGEEALRQAQKLESLGVLAGGIAHDFNNLLTAMLGNLNLARLKLPPNEDVDPHLEQVEKAVARASDLTRQMLAYSGKGRFQIHLLDLSLCVREMAELLQVTLSKRVRLTVDLAEPLPAIEADAAQLQQVILNLVTNASEAVGDEEGSITLRTGWVSLDGEVIQRDFKGQNLRSGAYVSLEVRDTGCGMGPDVLTRIFDPFFSTKQSGRGLGLSALLGILRGHQAGFRIESQVGVGTLFQVYFPASGSPLEAAPPPKPSKAARASGTVLLVDDEAMVRRSGRAMLENLGFSVLEAVDGQDALEVFEAHRDRIRWVLMDLTMPRMDGYSAFLALRGLDPAVKVVLSSGWTHAEATPRFREHPPTAFIPKPYSLKDVQATLEKAGLLAPAPLKA